MKWKKKGVIFSPNGQHDWMASHAALPTAERRDDDVLRVYFAARDRLGRSHPGFVDVEAQNPDRIIAVSEKPVLPLGRLGTFDDNGITPSCLISHQSKRYLYYIGWNPQVTVSYRLAIGLAISNGLDSPFEKYSEGPLLDRAVDEPFFNTAPSVLVEGDVWRMWYVSCTGWEIVNGHPEPIYHVKYAESLDGLNWRRTGRVCIDYGKATGSIGRPFVIKEGGVYKMFYSFRGRTNYRTDPEQTYCIGYAESTDGLQWVRRDAEIGLHRSDAGWDSDMIEYSAVYRVGSTLVMFYNGNGFGATGFGYAVLADGE